MATRKRIQRQKLTFSFDTKTFLCMIILLTGILIFTNIMVYSKMYKLIKIDNQISALQEEKKELLQEQDYLTSPSVVRDKAMNNLNMVAVENIDELLVIRP